MSRGKQGSGENKLRVQIVLDPELAQQLDQTMLSFGLESRSMTIQMMMKGWLSTVPVNATIHELCLQTLRELKNAEFVSLTEYHEQRARLYRSGQ